MHLTSLKNPIVQRAYNLRQSKIFRHAEGVCLVFGDHLIKEISHSLQIDCLFTTDPYQNLPAKETFFVTKEILEKIIGKKTHDQFAAIVPIPSYKPLHGERFLVFDRLQDPGNVGTLLRSLEAFGFDGAVFLDDTVDPFNEKVIRASMGAVFRVPLIQCTAEILLDSGISLIGADMDGTSINHFSPPSKFALILGHEGQGLAPIFMNKIEKIKIPMLFPTESLNVAQAGAILLYALGKTRGL